MELWTVADAARCAVAELGPRRENLPGGWRCLLQLRDDYERARRGGGLPAGAALFGNEPPSTGDRQVDAALAALAEHLARRDGWPVPAWAFAEERYAQPWWFPAGVVSWHAMALVQSPLAFHKRGVFLTDGDLERV